MPTSVKKVFHDDVCTVLTCIDLKGTFFSLQALIIIAYSPKWHSFLTDMYEFKKLISVFITAAALRLLQGNPKRFRSSSIV
jgi:hypothetical protein